MEFDLDSYHPLPVRYELRYVVLEKLQLGEDPLPEIDGREKTKLDVIRAVLSCSHIYLVSREGTGKTRLAESLAKLLPPVPKIKGCPYNCDPKWPRNWLCPRCREAENPAEDYGIDFISSRDRYNRIQGNEYTNEAKVLGVKDIQAIVQGKSPADPSVFIGTGVLRGNRGIVCVDELPAIPTKVQVLFHPMLQEGKIILEEYHWERPTDMFFIATGNPVGFAHVNRIPEPLLDRLELISMDLPDEMVERRIMFKERFKIDDNTFTEQRLQSRSSPLNLRPEMLKRSVAAPWWIVNIINKTSRYTRACPNIDRGASIRGSIKALDHTFSSTEMRKGAVSNLADAGDGLKLSLRGRIRLRHDIIGFDEGPMESMKKNELVVEDILWHAVRDVGTGILVGLGEEFDREALGAEVNHMLSMDGNILDNLSLHPLLSEAVNWMEEVSSQEFLPEVEGLDDLRDNTDVTHLKFLEEYRLAALELLANALLALDVVDSFSEQNRIFVPRRMVE